MRKWLNHLVIASALLFGCLGCTDVTSPLESEGPATTGEPSSLSGPPAYRHLRLGNPSNATENEADKDNYLLKKDLFAISYNSSKGTANWVSWHLVKSDTGDAPRKNRFAPDTTLPADFHRVKPTDYSGTGFDRGHLCPNADRDNSVENLIQTFVMSNMIPQCAPLNRQPWGELEAYCRKLVSGDEKELFIVAGPAGKGGTSDKGTFETIADGKITVPSKCWKVIMVLPKREGDPAERVRANTRIISVIMPNDLSADKDWETYRVSLRDVEALTGYTFFDRVKDETRQKLLDRTDTVKIR